jgi:O-antigen/teichoic acid export membrane protein
MSGVWGKVLSTTGARAFTVAALLVSTAITARALGPDGRGVIAAALAWVALFTSVGHLSLSPVAVHRGAGRERGAEVGRIAGTVLALVGVIALLGWGVALGGWLLTGGSWFRGVHPGILALTFLQLPLLLWTEAGLSLFLLLDALPAVNRAQVAGGCVIVAATFLLVVVAGAGVPGAIGALLLGRLVTVGMALAAVRRRVEIVRPSWPLARELVAGGLRLHPSALATAMTLQAPVLLLSHLRPPAEAGYYQLALQFVTGMQLLATSVGLVAYTLVAERGPDGAWPRQRVLLGQAVALSAVTVLVGWIAAPLLVEVVGGPEFLPAVPVLRVMLLAVPGMTFATVMASQWVGRGFFGRVAALGLTVSVTGVAAAWLGIRAYGVVGAAAGFVMTYVVGVLVNGAMALWVQRIHRAAPPPAPAPAGPTPAS